MNGHDLHSAAKALQGEVSGGQVLFPPPGHSRIDRSAALKFDPGAPEGFIVHSFAGDDPIPIRDFVKDKLGIARKPTGNGREHAANGQKHASRKVCAYIYKSADGSPYLRVDRYEPKSFPQYHWTGTGWSSGKPKGPKIPYRLPELLEAAHDVVMVCEGEKDADNLAALGFVATTASEGAGKWTSDLNRWFKGRTVYVLEDNDDQGVAHAQQVASNLHGVAASVRIVRLPGLVEKGDVSDWLAAGGQPDDFVRLCDAAPEWKPEGSKDEAESKALPFTAFDDIQVDVKKPWIMKGVIARGETSSLIGGPGKGKSALFTDLAVHTADGRDWRGYRSKERCAVVILAFERADLMLRRLEAYKRRHGLKDLPIVVVRASVDILKSESVEILTDTVRAVERRFNLPVGLLGLDTYSKAIALGGGDENQAKDVNRFLGHLRLVQAQTNVHIALVGHTGKDETKGHRGSNAHLGDIDVEVTISGDTVRSAIVTKANDQPEGVLTTYTLETFDFGVDEDGDAITTSILSDAAPAAVQAGNKPKRLNHGEQVALKMLHEALAEAGERPPESNHIPGGVGRVVTKDLWRRYCYKGGISADEATDDARQKAFKRAVQSLQTRKLIGVWEPHVWVAEAPAS